MDFSRRQPAKVVSRTAKADNLSANFTREFPAYSSLLRNPSVLKRPLDAEEAVEVIQTYRRHPRWRLIGFTAECRPLHDALWQRARRSDFAFRRLYDARSALTMTAHGVTEFATVNVKDYEGLGFRKVWNPLQPLRKS